MVRAGDHWSLRISRHMAPDCEEMFGCLPGRDRGRMGSEREEDWARQGVGNMVSEGEKTVQNTPLRNNTSLLSFYHVSASEIHSSSLPSLPTHHILVRNFILGGSKG